MTCEAFDAALPDYIEDALDDSTRRAVDAHLRECLRCAGLVRDLENIRKEAAALTDLVPARDLWAGIEARIAAPVIPLARPERPRRFAPAWMGIAAAALVVATAGITYQLTSRSLRSGPDARIAQTTPQTPAQDRNDSAVASSGITEPTVPAVNSRATGPSSGATGPSSSSRFANSDQQSALEQSEQVYGKEIAMLQAIVSQRKTQLDSSTVAIIEQNLKIIDAAIARSRAALAKDPASLLLSEQLTHVLDKKVELLRTAALLPAST
jgi:anti-sigma factor RsiW